ncbi:unnamed protein product [Euphydryas editha]|uniref:Uncharacterized protein n=1 Tax=Euphydryas editha TaxID=104508 RepID=A0AAU9V0T1_EUPED|nr:unnamed protein product [Euphydryas editha]
MKFAALRIGLEPKYHVDDCYLNEVNPAKRQRQKCETHRISMSLKVHMLHAHIDKFENNLAAYSEEQGKRFYQDIIDFEQRYQCKYNENMMEDYILGLSESTYKHERKTSKFHF